MVCHGFQVARNGCRPSTIGATNFRPKLRPRFGRPVLADLAALPARCIDVLQDGLRRFRLETRSGWYTPEMCFQTVPL